MKKINLIPLSESHLQLVLEWRNAPEVRKNMYTSHQISNEEHRRWFLGLDNDITREYFVCEIDDILSGVIGFSEINRVKGVATWAFYASASAPRGTGSLMEFAALNYAFNVLKLKKLRCEVIEYNQSVVKLHKKFGFEIEGVIRKGYFDGKEYHSVIYLGILDEEWIVNAPLLERKLRLS